MADQVFPMQGGCQCGVCRYEVTSKPFVAYTCHCRACQKMTASAFLSCMQVPHEDVRLLSGEPKLAERTADSGNRLVTSFCAVCGSTLFAHNSARPRVRTVHIGSLDDPASLGVSAHIWVSHKLPWVVLPAGDRVFERGGDWTYDYKRDPTRYHEKDG